MDDPLGLFDSDSASFLDSLGDPSGGFGNDSSGMMGVEMNQGGIPPQQQQAPTFGQQQGFDNMMPDQGAVGQKMQQFSFDNDFGGGGSGTAMPNMQGNMQGMANPSQPQPVQNMMSPNHPPQFGSPPPGTGQGQVPPSPQANPGFKQYTMQQPNLVTPPRQASTQQIGVNQSPMWNRSPGSQSSNMSGSPYNPNTPQQPNQFIQHDYSGNQNTMGPNGQSGPVVHHNMAQNNSFGVGNQIGSPPPTQRLSHMPQNNVVSNPQMNPNVRPQYPQSSQPMIPQTQTNYQMQMNGAQPIHQPFNTYGQQPQQQITQNVISQNTHFQQQNQGYAPGFQQGQQQHPSPQGSMAPGMQQQQVGYSNAPMSGAGTATQSFAINTQSQQQVAMNTNMQNGSMVTSSLGPDGNSSMSVNPTVPIQQQNLEGKIVQLQTQIQALYNMQQTPETQQKMLNLQEEVRTLRAQQQQQLMQQRGGQPPSTLGQVRPQQAYVIMSGQHQQLQQQGQPGTRPMQQIVLQQGQVLRGLQPGQTIQVQRPGQPMQTIRIQQQQPNQIQNVRMQCPTAPQIQAIRLQPPQQISPQQAQTIQQVPNITQAPHPEGQVSQIPEPSVSEQSGQAQPSVGQLQTSAPNAQVIQAQSNEQVQPLPQQQPQGEQQIQSGQSLLLQQGGHPVQAQQSVQPVQMQQQAGQQIQVQQAGQQIQVQGGQQIQIQPSGQQIQVQQAGQQIHVQGGQQIHVHPAGQQIQVQPSSGQTIQVQKVDSQNGQLVQLHGGQMVRLQNPQQGSGDQPMQTVQTVQIRTSQPGQLVQTSQVGQTLQQQGGQTIQLAPGKQVHMVKVMQPPQQQQQNAPRLQIVQQASAGAGQQKIIQVIVKKPNSVSPVPSQSSPNLTNIAPGEETGEADSSIPATVTNTEGETGDATDGNKTTPAKPKRKRPSKKKSAEQEKADKIIQEAIAKAQADGREVPKVIETEDGEIIEIPQKKKSPKKKKSPAEPKKERPKKETKPKVVKPKPLPKPRPPKKKKTIPTFLLSKKRRKRDESDEEVRLTPPSSPVLDDAFKRRSTRNTGTKRKKYLDEVDLDLSEEENDNDANNSLVQLNMGGTSKKNDLVSEEERLIVDKILGVRMGQRILLKEPTEPVITEEEVVKPTDASNENLEVDIEGEDAPTDVKVNEEDNSDPTKDETEGSTKTEDIAENGQDEEKKPTVDEDMKEVEKETGKHEEKQIENQGHDNTTDEKKVDVTSPTTGAVKFLTRTKTVEEEDTIIDVEEFYVKYKNFSYLHCEWKTALELEWGDKRVHQKIKRYRAKPPPVNAGFDTVMDEEYFNPDYVEVDRIIEQSVVPDASSQEEVTHYLVKWRSLAYEDSTWELEQDVEKSKIEEFQTWRHPPDEEDRDYVSRPSSKDWKEMDEMPTYKNDNMLREYQLEGINWLLFCYYNRQNCILADEMGLGKTIQSIAFLKAVYDLGIKGPYLVIVPLSTLGNWQREFEMWTDMNAIVYHGTQPSRNMLQEFEMYYKDEDGKVIPDLFRFQALITTYEVIIQDVELLSNIEWRVCIIDEAHRLKNQKCKLSEGLKVFDLEHKVLLTGTPLQNNVEELFALLHFLEPRQFATSESFLIDFGDLKSETQVDKLKAILKPMMLRRLKEDVEKSLAPKEETIVEVELTNIQKKYYRAILERNFTFLAKGVSCSNVPNLMNTMMELRKCCNHPFLIDGCEEKIMQESNVKTDDGFFDQEKAFQAMVQASGKLVLIDKLLPKLKAGDHKVLVFSQMIRVLDIIEDYLIQKRYLYERIDGRIRGNLRQEAIDRFSKPESDRFVFLLCTRAGGLGINLTAADTVIIYDSDWNPQNDLQAQARCHRIGQTKEVKIYRLITRNSYEREMFDKASLKLGLDKAVLQSMGSGELGSKPNQLGKKEIENLLKKGAYGALMEEDNEGDEFCEEDIDQILKRRTQIVQIEAGEKGSTFAKASFSVSNNRSDIDIDDPNFWQKWAKKADVDVDEINSKNELIIELPRQRKQTSRYTYPKGEIEGMSELESSDGGSDSDGEGRSKKGKLGRGGKPGRRRRGDDDDDGPIDGPFDYYTRSDCFKVEKHLLVYGWGRWEDILVHGRHKRNLKLNDVITITRTILLYSLQQYAGDERIKGFIYDLIAPRAEGEEMDHRNHSGLSAPVPRGRKGKKVVRAPGPTDQDVEMMEKMDVDPENLLADEGYKKHLKRHANKVLLRVRLLYYLKYEVIGDHAEKILSGTPAYEIPIPTPFADADPPVYWWDIEADRSLIVGVFKHGFEKYNLMRQDGALCFLARCGPPDQALVNAEMNDEEVKNMSDEECDPEFKPKKRGRPGRKKANASMLDDEEDMGGTPTKNTPQKPVVRAEEGKHPWPTGSDLNTRLRRIITGYQRNHKREMIRMEQEAKKNEKRQRFETVIQERERQRLDSRQRWVRRDEAEFYRVVSTFGIERDRNTLDFKWNTFKRLAHLEKKYDDNLTMYFKAFYHMCKRVCRKFVVEADAVPPNDIIVEPITEERANRCLARIDLLNKIREMILWHPKLEERLKSCQRDADMPDWWVPGEHDKDLLIGAAKHGLSRTDYHIVFDPKLCFKEVVQQQQKLYHERLAAMGHPPLVTNPTASGNNALAETQTTSTVIGNDDASNKTKTESGEKLDESGAENLVISKLKTDDTSSEGLDLSAKSKDPSVSDSKDNVKVESKMQHDSIKTELKSESSDEKDSKMDIKSEIKCENDELSKEDIKDEPSELKVEPKDEPKLELQDQSNIEPKSESTDIKDTTPKKEEISEEKTDGDTEDGEEAEKKLHDKYLLPKDESKPPTPLCPFGEDDTNMSGDCGMNDSGTEAAVRAQHGSVPLEWPKDRIIFHHVENVCLCIEKGEWPFRRGYRLGDPYLSDSRSSTPVPGTPLGSSKPGTPMTHDYQVLGISDASADGLKLTFQKKKRGRRSRAEIEAERNARLLQLMNSQGLTVSDAESESNLSGYGLENGTGSPMRRDDEAVLSGTEANEFLLKKKRGRKRKIDKLLDAAAAAASSDGSPLPLLKRQAWESPSQLDTEAHVAVINMDDGTRLAGEDAPKRRDLARWLERHPGYTVEGVEEMEEHHGPGRRKTRIDPKKLELGEVTGEENVAVINRETGKRITGAKAPPLKHLTQWLEKNPGFDVDPQWAHIVKAKGKVPEDMQHRILIPQGRGRRPTNLAQQPQAASASATAAASSEYYAALSQMMGAGVSDPSAMAQYVKYAMSVQAMGTNYGSLSSMAGMNPMYAAQLQQYTMAMQAQEEEEKKEKEKKAERRKSEESAAKEAKVAKNSGAKETPSQSTEAALAQSQAEALAASLTAAGVPHSAFPFMSYMSNPMMLSQVYAQTLANYQQGMSSQGMSAQSFAALAQAQMLNGGMSAADASSSPSSSKPSAAASSSTPKKAEDLSVKKHRVRDNAVEKPAKPSTSDSIPKPEDLSLGIDLSMKKPTAQTPPKPSTAELKQKSPRSGRKGFSLENIVQDLSMRVKSDSKNKTD